MYRTQRQLIPRGEMEPIEMPWRFWTPLPPQLRGPGLSVNLHENYPSAHENTPVSLCEKTGVFCFMR
jgi:hypothetical protein